MDYDHRPKIWLALLVSILLHILGGGALWQVFEQARMAQLQQTPPQISMQIVDLTMPANEITPEKARFVGTKDNATTEETVAHNKPRTNMMSSQEGSESGEKQQQQAARQREPRSQHKAQKHPSDEQAMAEPAKRRPAPATAIVRDFGGRSVFTVPEDYFPNYKHAGHTYVNVLRHPGVGYFVELKRALKIAWNPVPALRSAGPSFYGNKKSVKVVVGVTVDTSGALNELFVLRGSGSGAYDREALRAFRATFPFFAPPASVMGMDGRKDDKLNMSWSFHVYL